MAATIGALTSARVKLGPSRFGIGLSIMAALAAVIVYIATSPRPPSSSPQAIQTETINDSSDMYAAVQYVKQIGAEYRSPQISTVTLKILPVVPLANPDVEILAPNGTLIQVIGKPTTDEQDGWRTWTWPITVYHSGHIGPEAQDLEIRIRYAVVSPEGRTEIKLQRIPVNLTVQMLDFPQLAYMGMIALGIIASYLAADGAKIRSKMVNNFGEIKRPIVWIVLSMILTPLVYVQFKQATGSLTGDQALVSLLMALPFGAGLDLALGKAAAGRS